MLPDDGEDHGAWGEIRDKVEADSIHVEKYVKELSLVTMHLTKACGRIFGQKEEQWRR